MARGKKGKPKIEWNVPKAERTAGRSRAVTKGRKRITYEAAPGRKNIKPERGRSPQWESLKDKVTSGTKRLPDYTDTQGMTEELKALRPGAMLVLTEHVQIGDEWQNQNWPIPRAVMHNPRSWDTAYDPEKEIHLAKGGMVVYMGHEVIDATRGEHNMRMDIYKFLIRDGVYVITNLRLVEVPKPVVEQE